MNAVFSRSISILCGAALIALSTTATDADAKKKKKDKKDKKDKDKGEAAAELPKLEPREIKKMKPPQLKEALKERGLDISGNKKELEKRLLEACK